MKTVEESIQEIIKSIRPQEEGLSLKDSPESLDFDSLDMVEMEMAIEDEFDISEIPASFFWKPFSDLVRYIENEVQDGI